MWVVRFTRFNKKQYRWFSPLGQRQGVRNHVKIHGNPGMIWSNFRKSPSIYRNQSNVTFFETKTDPSPQQKNTLGNLLWFESRNPELLLGKTVVFVPVSCDWNLLFKGASTLAGCCWGGWWNIGTGWGWKKMINRLKLYGLTHRKV